MRRRNFIIGFVSACTAVAVGFKLSFSGFFTCSIEEFVNSFKTRKLSKYIGGKYLKLRPKIKVTFASLLPDTDPDSESCSDILENVEKKIDQDFKETNLQIVNSWIIPETSARLSALLYSK